MKRISRLLVILMLFTLLEPALLSIRASADNSIELVPIANKMIDDTSVYPGGDFDEQDLLIVGYEKKEGTVFGYSESMLKFDVSSIDPARTIQSATLEFNVKSVYKTPDNRMDMQPHLNLYGSNNDGWQEDGIRVNLSKDYPIVVGQELVNGYSTYSFDVKNFIVSQVNDGKATFVLTGRQIPNDLLASTETNVESAFAVFARSTNNPPRLLIEYEPVSEPVVETGNAAQIAVNSAMISAKVVSDGGKVVTERGIEYRKRGAGSYTKAVAPSGLGSYNVQLTGLEANTIYEYRAYATNEIGTSYGIVVTFTTKAIASTISADQSLTEENLHGRKLTVKLSGTTFKTPLNATDFTLQNAPKGLTISQVERTNDTEAIVTLAFDGTDFDSDHLLGLKVAGTALASGADLAVTSPLLITATKDTEWITLSQLDDIWEREENGKVIVVTLRGGTFAKTLNPTNWTVSNLPSGVSKGTITRIDSKTVRIILNGDSTAPYAGDIKNVTVSLPKDEYDDSTGGGALSASGILLRAKQAPTVSTGGVADVTANSATVAGEVTADGKLPITERGIEYRKNGASSYTKVTDSLADIGSYNIELTNLEANTTYEYRAYATNAKGTSYGGVMTFTTQAITASMSADQSLTEENLHGRQLTVALSGTTFKTPLNATDFTLQNAPKGLTISQVERINDTEALVTLSFDGTDFDSNHSLGLTIAGTTLTSEATLLATPPLPILATNDPESITLSQLDEIWEGEEDGKKLVVTLEGGTFAKTLTPANWTVDNLPTGVSRGIVERIDSKTVHITLNGNVTLPYTGNITNVEIALTTAEYDDSTGGATLSASTGIVLQAKKTPSVSTELATKITPNSAWIAGKVSSDGRSTLTERGVEYREVGSIAFSKVTADKIEVGTYEIPIVNLKPNTIYEYRSYATNGKGTTFGLIQTFSTMALSQNAELQNIVLSTGSMNEPFLPNELHYTANVGNHVREVQITATTADLFATMEIAGQQVLSGQPSPLIPLVVGNNEIVIEVTAEDGTKKTYLVTVSRKQISGGSSGIPSSNPNLTDLAIFIGEDNILKGFSADETAYQIETEANSIDLSFETTPGASIFVNGEKMERRMQIDLADGENAIEIVVRAEDGKEKTYALMIKRLKVVPFSDISGHWAEEYIKEAYRNGWFKGYPNGDFGPENHVTRKQSASLFVRILGLTERATVSFTDIHGVDLETLEELERAYASGVIKGYSDETFKPYANVTRAQLALMFYRSYEKITGMSYEPKQQTDFPDIALYDEETKKAIAMLVELGIAEGSEGIFLPNNHATRAHAAKMLVNYKKVLASLE